MWVLSCWVMTEKSKKEILSKEQEQLSMSQLVWKCWVEYLMLLVTQSMDMVQSKQTQEEELNWKHQELFQERVSTNQCKQDWRLLIVWFQLEEDKENWLLVIDKQERQLLLLIQSSTKSQTLTLVTRINNYIAFTLLLVKRDQLLLTWLRFLHKLVLWNTQSWLQPQPQKLLHFNI